MRSDAYCVVLTTFEKREDAETMARLLLEKRLAACIQVMPITSYYEWEKKICNDDELLMLIKSRSGLYELIEKTISDNHPYDVPEIIRLPVEAGLTGYLNWISEVTEVSA